MAERDVVALNEATPQLEVPQGSDTYRMPCGVNIEGDLLIANRALFEETGTRLGSGTAIAAIDTSGGTLQLWAGARYTTGGNLVIKADGDFDFRVGTNAFLKWDESAGQLVVKEGAGTKDNAATFDSSGMTLLQGGIKLDGLSSSDAHTLDDYEEGAWTPTLSDGTNTLSPADFDVQYGAYRKIGTLVFVDMRIKLNSVGSLSGLIHVAGLPFNKIAAGDDRPSLQVGYFAGANLAAASALAGAVAEFSSASKIFPTVFDSTSGPTGLDASEITSAFELRISGAYITED